jgi:hypothetical protein
MALSFLFVKFASHTLIHTLALKNPLPHFVLDSLRAEV